MLKGIKVVVEAVDRVSAPIRAIGGSLRNINLAPLRNQLGRVISAAKTAGAEIGRMARNVGLAISGMAAAAGVILARVARSSNDAAAGAERLGISMKAYQGLGYAAKRSGADISEMEAALKDLNNKVLDAVNGNKELRSGFKRMGVELRDAKGNLRPTEEIFVDIANAFARVPDGAKKSAAAMALMGNAGVKMIPLLNRGGDSIRDMMEEAERLGLVFDEKTAAGFQKIAEDMQRLGAVITGLQNTIATKLLPIFTPLLESFTEWAIVNRAVIATRISEWIERIPGLLSQAEQAGRTWLEALSPIGSAIAWIVEQLGPFHSGIGLVSAVIGGKLLVTLWPLLRALSGLGLVIGKMTLGPLVAMFAQLFTAIRAGTGVMAAFNLVLAANPIGAVILAVAALAAAAYLIYRNWDAVVPYFTGLWDAVKRVFNGVVEFVAGVFTGDFGRALDGIETIAAGLADYLIGLWSPVYDALRAVLGWIDGQFGTDLLAAFDGLVAGIRNAIAALGAFLSERWSDIRAVFEGFGEFLLGVFTGDFTRAFEGLRTMAEGIIGYFTDLWSPVTAAFKAVEKWISGTFAPMMKTAVQLVYDYIAPIINKIAAAIDGISAGIDKVAGAAGWAKDKVSSGVGAVSGGVSSAWTYVTGGGTPTPESPSSPPVAPNLPTAFGAGMPGQKVDASGVVDVNVHYDRPPTVRAQMNDPRIRTDVSAGPSMVTP